MEKIEELLHYLKSLGFEGELLEKYIREYAPRSEADFKVDHQIAFGEAMMHYELGFVFDRQFMAYRLEAYKANYRPPVTIEHKTINGIDSAAVDKKMSQIDWAQYFYSEMNEVTFQKDLTPLFQELWALSNDHNRQGAEIQSKLIYKYWPNDNWNDGADLLHSEFRTNHLFKAGALGLPNATLAYNIASGRLEHLYKAINQSGIEQYAGMDLHNLLATYCSDNSPHFKIEAVLNKDEGILQFIIPVSLESNDYIAKEMQVTFTWYPEVLHGIYNGVDTGELEQQMSMINWETGDLYLFNDQEEVQLLPYVQSIKDRITLLVSHEDTQNIGAYLQIKYWSDSFMQMYVDEDIWQMKNWDKVQQRFSLEESAAIIGNFMCGRPVHSSELKVAETKQEGWFIIDPTVSINELNPMEFIMGLSRAKVETMVNMLPLDGTIYVGDIIHAIARGERLALDLIGINGHQQVNVKANPREEQLDLSTPEGDIIPFNYRLDPHWSPGVFTSLKTEQQVGSKQKSQLSKNRKGISKRS